MCVCRTSVTPSGNTTRTCLARMNWLTLSFRVRRKGRNGLRKIVSSFGCSALHFPQAAGAAAKPRGSVLKIPCSDRHQSETPFGSNEEHRKRGASTRRRILRKAYRRARNRTPHRQQKRDCRAESNRSQSLAVPITSCNLVIPPSSTTTPHRRTCRYGSTSPVVTVHVFASRFWLCRRFRFAFSRRRPPPAILPEMILDKALAPCLA